MIIKETFEIKKRHQTGHAPGLVVVLDSLVSPDAHCLVGRTATIHFPSGKVLELVIDEAKEHGPVNTLFFRNLTRSDVTVGSEIAIGQELKTPSPIAS